MEGEAMIIDGLKDNEYFYSPTEESKTKTASLHLKSETQEKSKELNQTISLQEDVDKELSSPEKRRIETMLKELNKKLYGSHREVRFSIHEKSKKLMVRVMDMESGKLVHEIPSEKSLDLLAKMMEKSSVMADLKR
jgi:flagellar protein FlaG